MRLFLSRLALSLSAIGCACAQAAELPTDLQALVPEQWSSVPPTPTGPWWSSVDASGGLGMLIEQAMARNVDTMGAAWSTDQARARRERSRGGLLPSLSADASTSYGLLNSAVSSDPASSGTAMLNANLPLTPWAALPSLAASDADARTSEARERSTRALIATQTASLWFEVALADTKLELVQAQVSRDQDLLGLVESRFRTGDATTLDVLQQQQQLAATEASLPDVEVRVVTARRDLASLLGRFDAHFETMDLPVLPNELAFPAPTVVVSSLPDVVIAVETQDSARHASAAARSAYAPTLSGRASAGWNITNLKEPAFDETWSAGLNLSIPLYSAGRTAAGVREARATRQSADRALEQAVLDAVFGVEDALAIEGQRRAEYHAIIKQERKAQAAKDAAVRQYEAGLSTWTTVLSSLATQQQAELSLLQARRNHMSAWLDVQVLSSGTWLSTLEER